MPLTFVNPGLLLGALAAVVPIVIHFLSRRRIRRQPFSDLRFLEDVQASQARRVGIRSLLLLLLRVLIILCVALAVARPQLGGLAPSRGSGRSLLFILDISASMQTQHDGGTRYAAAQAIIADLAAAAPRGSEVQVLLAAGNSEPLFNDWTSTNGPLVSTLTGIAPTDGSLDLAQALSQAAGWVERSRWQPVDIVFLSDLQRTQGGGMAIQEAARQLIAAGSSRLLFRQVGEQVPNGGVLATHLPLRAVRPGETIDISATVRPDRSEQSFLLELDGRRVAEAVAGGGAGTLSRVTFTITSPEAGAHRGQILKDSDRLPADDIRPFVMTVWDQVSVLIVHGADRGQFGRGGWRYLAEALKPSTSEQALFEVNTVPSAQLVTGDLAGIDVVIFIDPDPLGRQLLGELLSWLADGGAVVFCVGDPTIESYLNESLLPALGLPATAAFRGGPGSGFESVKIQEPGHPIFAGLDKDALATLQDVRWRRFFALEEGNESRVLLTFASETPALLEGRYREGTFMWLPFALLPTGSDLPLSPMFLPLVQRLTAYLAAGSRHREAVDVGQRPELRLGGSRAELGEQPASARLNLLTPDGAADLVPADLTWQKSVPVLVGPATRKRGFYTFLAGGDSVGVVAAATPAAESDPTLLTVTYFREMLAEVGLDETADLGGIEPAAFTAALAGREIGLWLLVIAFVLLCVESYLARGTEGKSVSS